MNAGFFFQRCSVSILSASGYAQSTFLVEKLIIHYLLGHGGEASSAIRSYRIVMQCLWLSSLPAYFIGMGWALLDASPPLVRWSTFSAHCRVQLF
jgi:hypothetical protein